LDAEFRDALRETEDGVVVELEVTPGARKLEVPQGYNPWRKRIQVKLTEKAVSGSANRQLIHCLAKMFKTSPSNILLLKGESNSLKSVKIKGVNIRDVQRALELGGPGKA